MHRARVPAVGDPEERLLLGRLAEAARRWARAPSGPRGPAASARRCRTPCCARSRRRLFRGGRAFVTRGGGFEPPLPGPKPGVLSQPRRPPNAEIDRTNPARPNTLGDVARKDPHHPRSQPRDARPPAAARAPRHRPRRGDRAARRHAGPGAWAAVHGTVVAARGVRGRRSGRADRVAQGGPRHVHAQHRAPAHREGPAGAALDDRARDRGGDPRRGARARRRGRHGGGRRGGREAVRQGRGPHREAAARRAREAPQGRGHPRARHGGANASGDGARARRWPVGLHALGTLHPAGDLARQAGGQARQPAEAGGALPGGVRAGLGGRRRAVAGRAAA